MQNPINFCIDITNEKAGKEAVMAVYDSQNSEKNYPELVIALNKTRTLSLRPRWATPKVSFSSVKRTGIR